MFSWSSSRNRCLAGAVALVLEWRRSSSTKTWNDEDDGTLLLALLPLRPGGGAWLVPPTRRLTHKTTHTEGQKGATGLRSDAASGGLKQGQMQEKGCVGYPAVAVLVGLLVVLVPPCLPASPPKAAREEAGRAEGGGPCSGLGTTGFSATHHTYTDTTAQTIAWAT